jgi:hypothetical protein
MVKVFQTFANERQLKRKIGAFEITSATQYTPKPADDDYLKKNDVPWIKRFATAGGRVIISGDTEMRYVPHERLALIQAGMLVFFFDGKWSQWDFFSKVLPTNSPLAGHRQPHKEREGSSVLARTTQLA